MDASPLPSIRPLRALLLDVDNTLVDRAGAFPAYADRLLAAAGRAGDADLRLELIELDAGCYTARPLWARVTLAALPSLGWSYDQLRADFEEQILMLLQRPSPVLAELQALRGRVRLVACTNGPSALQKAKITGAGLVDLLDGAVISGELGGRKKPAPVMFETALRAAGSIAAEAMMVGDNPEHDVLGAQAHGLRTAWIDGCWRRFELPVPLDLRADFTAPTPALMFAELSRLF